MNLRIACALLTCLCLLHPVMGEEKSKPNRLAKEASPYLRQHAHNPVDWYPWGEEAFKKAKAEILSLKSPIATAVRLLPVHLEKRR